MVAGLTLGAGVLAPELYALEPEGPRRLTKHGAEWLEGLDLPAVDVIEIDGPAGPIQTMLVHPAGAGPEARATVLIPHGGPTDQWAVVPPLEAILLAGAGYRVALPNIRGSTDRGGEWVKALGGDWGGPDAEDCHALLDNLVDAGLADPGRLGCSGLSYGGFLVNWLIGTSDRFRAAVSENGVVNQIAAWANSDCGAVYSRADQMGDPTTPEGAERLWRISPLRHVGHGAAVRGAALAGPPRCPRPLPGRAPRLPGQRPLRPPPGPPPARARMVRPAHAGLTADQPVWPDSLMPTARAYCLT